MSDRLNISYCANIIADALHRALKAGHITKIGIDDIRSAVIGYLASAEPQEHDPEWLIQATVRKVVEKVG